MIDQNQRKGKRTMNQDEDTRRKKLLKMKGVTRQVHIMIHESHTF